MEKTVSKTSFWHFSPFKGFCFRALLYVCFFLALVAVFLWQYFFGFYPKVLVVAKSSFTTYPYAKIENDGVLLYKSNASLNPENAYFEIPKSYYVLLISNIDGSFYRAQYRDTVGYVLKSSVVPVLETPDTPYLEGVTFRVYSTDGTNVFSRTKNLSDEVISGHVEVMSTIDYYGTLQGVEYIEGRGSTWYYGKTSEGVFGYLYAGLCDNLSTIPENTEPYTPSPDPFFDDDMSYLYSLAELSTPLKVTLILIIVLPAFAIVFLLFRPTKKLSKTLTPKNRKPKKLDHAPLNKIQKVIDDEPL